MKDDDQQDRPLPSRIPGRITSDHRIMGGAPCLSGTRIPASWIKEMLEGDTTAAQVLADYPELSAEDIAAARAWHPEPEAEDGSRP